MQTPRISTKARETAENLAILMHRIHDDGTVTRTEIAECRVMMRALLDLIAEVDDTNALTVAILRGGLHAPRVGELARDIERTRGVVVPFANAKRRRRGTNHNDAA